MEPLRWHGHAWCDLLCLLVALLAVGKVSAQLEEFEQAPIFYSKTKANDPVADWQQRLKDRSLQFDDSSERAFLKDVLRELAVPEASQVLVYSKTSLQIDGIRPSRPRALYFSEDYYLGWVQGGDIEIISFDPKIGPIFYTLSVPDKDSVKTPRMTRSRDCMGCHGSSRTNHVPGMLVRSMYTDVRGFPIFSAGSFRTTPASPLKERWGGWYVTGTHAGERHMGNLLYSEPTHDDTTLHKVRDLGVDLETLDEVLDVKPYLKNTSDMVALMVMEHQIAAHNALIKAAMTTQRVLHRDRELAKSWDDSTNKAMSDTSRRVIGHQADQLLEVLLFKDEIELEGWGVEGSEAFQQAFGADALTNEEGRSLKDFELLGRLFKHRLSYMIYSKAFEDLPKTIKEVVYGKLLAALTDDTPNPLSAHLSLKERQRILSILLVTKSRLPEAWRAHAKGE